ncbi:NAD(P)/FAD-dependent oxidoreductase [Streptomyces sp. NPDC048001]|uniref:NAD(P)/FAD-dependent oxidoreductase n=1 Tax=unclassified Streptomyces TaxID=2593676 RepID=UPI0037138541
MHTTHHPVDVLVVGAGLAGLACARDLAAEGRTVSIVEASDAPGGRMRTDRRDGFLLDRGFQVFNTSYPQVRRRLDLRALRLHPFTPGLLVHRGGSLVRVVDPSRRPREAGALRPGRLAPTRDLLALGRLTAADTLLPAPLLKRRPERTTRTALAEAGVSEHTVDTLLRPFLSGVFLEDGLETSSRVFHLVWRSLVRGSLCLPAEGIGSVPAQLARNLPPGTVRYGAPVAELTPAGALLDDGGEHPARAVVVATGPREAARLLDGLDVPGTRTVTTYYHTAAVPPLDEPTLLVDAAGRFLNSCVLSRVAPGYAPRGIPLVSTSVLGGDRPGREREVRGALSEAYGADTGHWEFLAACTVEDALPAMPPPWPLSRGTRVSPGRYVCGDHRATGSVQGALASGARAAREVLADLSRGGTA